MAEQETNTKDKILDFYQRVEAQYETHSCVYGIPTGFENFDFYTGGLHRGQLSILAGQTSIGKTALAINLMNNILFNSKYPILFISYEMDSYTLLTRLFAASTEISLSRLFRGCLMAKHWEKLAKIMIKSSDAGENEFFNIKESYTFGFQELANDIRSFAEKHNSGVVFIDYFQLIKLEKEENRYEQMATNAAAIKRLAVELNIPIVLISQVNKRCEERYDRRPVLSDLFECDGLSHYADNVLFLHRDIDCYNYDDKGELLPEITTNIIVAKQRNRFSGEFSLLFNPETGCFKEKPKKNSNSSS